TTWLVAGAIGAGFVVLITTYFVVDARRRQKELASERENLQTMQAQLRAEQEMAAEKQAKEIAELKLALDERMRGKSGGPSVSDDITTRSQENNDGFVPAPPEELVEICASGDCVLFAGGGIAAQAGYPIWGVGLARLLEMAAEANPSSPWDSLRTALTNGDLSLVAELIRSRLPEDQLHSMVKATFKTES